MRPEPKTYFLATLGCAKNEIDSEALEGDLRSIGMRPAEDSQNADLILVNSCGFINDAKIETIQTVLDLHQERKEGSVLVLCGCLPARYNLTRSLDEVDVFLPWRKHGELLTRLHELGWQFGQASENSKRLIPVQPFSYLRISEGCDNRCSYCAIPDIKGPFNSRSSDDIIREAEYLCNNGARELVLIGQDTSLFGNDIGDVSALPNLLQRLSLIDNCTWIRLMYAHPAHLNDETIETIAGLEKVVNYIDLPLQHINNRILKQMNRKVTRTQVEKLIGKLRGKIPNIALRTTFIVGFPGETDSEFKELLDFCEEMEFANVGAFKYSPEEGTPAYNMHGRLAEELIEERYLTLLDIQNMISAKKLLRYVGTTQRVLFHGIGVEREAQARAWFQAPDVDGMTIIENCTAAPGEFVDVVIKRANAYDLYGKQLEGR